MTSYFDDMREEVAEAAGSAESDREFLLENAEQSFERLRQLAEEMVN